MEILLKDWYIKEKTIGNSKYYYAIGKIYGSKRFLEGSLVSTSVIVKCNDRKIKTRSGSSYILFGEPDSQFFEFLYRERPTLSDSLDKLMNNSNPLEFLNF